jgi:hypothetical protein
MNRALKGPRMEAKAMRTIAILFLTLWSGTAMAFENQKLLGAKPTQELQEAEDRAPCGSAARPASIDESLVRWLGGAK